jgi:hypothetical protein
MRTVELAAKLLAFATVFVAAMTLFGLAPYAFLRSRVSDRHLPWLVAVFGLTSATIFLSFVHYAGLDHRSAPLTALFLGGSALAAGVSLRGTGLSGSERRTLAVGLGAQLVGTSLLLCLFIIPQGPSAVSIPCYQVNHDPIGFLDTADYLASSSDMQNGHAEQGEISHVRNLLSSGYPIGFIQLLAVARSATRMDLYTLAFPLCVACYSLTIGPLLYMLAQATTFRLGTSLFIAGASLASYLPIQMVNQSFFEQTALTPLLFTLVALLVQAVADRDIGRLIACAVVLPGAMATYSFTALLWVAAPLLVVGIVSRHAEKLRTQTVTTGAVLTFLSLPAWPRVYHMLAYVFDRHSHDTVFAAIGNSLGYAPWLAAFGSWPGLDFRVADLTPRLQATAWITAALVVATVVVSYTWVRNRVTSRAFFVRGLVTFAVPVLAVRLFTQSPYFYNKTLYYGSIFLALTIYVGLLNILSTTAKWARLLQPIALASAVVIILRSYASLTYFGRPPVDLFAQLRAVSHEVSRLKLKSVTDVDDEEWAKHFLFDNDSCVTFVTTYGCQRGVTIAEDHIALGGEPAYVVRRRYTDRITNLEDYRAAFMTKDYLLVVPRTSAGDGSRPARSIATP